MQLLQIQSEVQSEQYVEHGKHEAPFWYNPRGQALSFVHDPFLKVNVTSEQLRHWFAFGPEHVPQLEWQASHFNPFL